MPIQELRKRSLINQHAKATDNDISARDFSIRILQSFPGMDLRDDQGLSDPD